MDVNHPFLMNEDSTNYHHEALDDVKICRICLQEDDPDQMIAPCLCKGSSKWVHRDCLDQWRVHERDRAFSQCTECHFAYHMQASPAASGDEADEERAAQWRRLKFYMLVSRDLLVVTVLIQVAICFMGWMIWVLDPHNLIVDALNGRTCLSPAAMTDDSHVVVNKFWCNHLWSAYYFSGLIGCLALLGCVGTVTLCLHGCNIEQAIPAELRQHQEEEPIQVLTFPSPVGTENTIHSMQPMIRTAEPSHYQSRHVYHRRHRQQQQTTSNNSDCCECCRYCSSSPIYNCYGCRNCVICWDDQCCCCGDTSAVSTRPSAGFRSGADSSNCECRECGDCGGEAGHILFVLFLLFLVIMAIVGFFVGLVLAVIVFQRIVQRHLFLRQKGLLAKEFVVKDLATYDLSRVEPVPPPFVDGREEAGLVQLPPPIPPPELHESDIRHLKSLGLMA